jgi:hypothetical protein
MPTLLLVSKLDKGSDEYRLHMKASKVIEGSLPVIFEEHNHFSIMYQSENVLPHVSGFLAKIS